MAHSAVTAGRLGTPRFVRCMLLCDDRATTDRWARELAEECTAWFGATAHQTTRESAGDGVTTVLQRWVTGEGALVTIGPAALTGVAGAAPAPRSTWVDLLISGTAGSLYHDGPVEAQP